MNQTVPALMVRINVKPEFKDQFMQEMLGDARGSERNEAGCLMFNITQDAAKPNILYLFEVYANLDAIETHKKSPHFIRWFETTATWIQEPLEINQCNVIYPSAGNWVKRPAPKE